MTPRQEIMNELGYHGWMVLRVGGDWLTAYRWVVATRIELHVMFDPLGRIEVWSEWHNHRHSIDHDLGRRSRLIERLSHPSP